MKQRWMTSVAALLLCACAGAPPPEPPRLAQEAPSGARGTACSIHCDDRDYSARCPRNAAPVCQCESKPYAYCMLVDAPQ
ncbi:hypothetical protein E4T66_11330 [Sinimarinibacterium sp. CAU 1509]|uniref:hypothetical protein n=1 Tax=Sinimarinibacterium sp. CAU 1509 TaxID=2562283 RepID=UPI0010ACCF20|nr:hypothetical protein [Sinimarinibacterium sp. CAU 1509]TJY59772.1 hypothetical protein E4T66_11330 [Sinimarinibacterium sp. CAU 1509]